jgi:hypothetical protein
MALLLANAPAYCWKKVLWHRTQLVRCRKHNERIVNMKQARKNKGETDKRREKEAS